jgi:hypothetical protein
LVFLHLDLFRGAKAGHALLCILNVRLGFELALLTGCKPGYLQRWKDTQRDTLLVGWSGPQDEIGISRCFRKVGGESWEGMSLSWPGSLVVGADLAPNSNGMLHTRLIAEVWWDFG